MRVRPVAFLVLAIAAFSTIAALAQIGKPGVHIIGQENSLGSGGVNIIGSGTNTVVHGSSIPLLNDATSAHLLNDATGADLLNDQSP